MELGLEGKVALVTGAGSQIGMGKAISLTLAKEGCDIIATDIDLEGAQKTAAEVETLGRKAMAVKADVTKSAEVNDMVKAALAQFGRIDILVNAAGAVSGAPKPFLEITEANRDMEIGLNLKGVMNCAGAVLPKMIERKSGKIINITSVGAKKSLPKTAVYASAKAGVVKFTQVLANEVASSGINVNSVAPGAVMTNFGKGAPPPDAGKPLEEVIPLGRPQTAQDIANMVAFFASDVAGNITGQNIGVDGGMSIT
jgi:NAD(P)-dependent dehydrogenase (short-subunit alcohol dehydrogenase family)